MANDERPIVVKVGGSLFDLPELGKRLQAWWKPFKLKKIIIIPGGGQAADAVRLFDRVQQLGEERAHWCALQSLNSNSFMLDCLITEGSRAYQLADLHDNWRSGHQVQILFTHQFLRSDENNPDHLPHSWDVSSDSVSARVAIVVNAKKLMLLKSVSIPPGMTWTEASERGYVDKYFPTALAQAGDLEVEAVNFRLWQPPT
jgi:5-(aminomethyl)-3-furanmethanol phosphate kinase